MDASLVQWLRLIQSTGRRQQRVIYNTIQRILGGNFSRRFTLSLEISIFRTNRFGTMPQYFVEKTN